MGPHVQESVEAWKSFPVLGALGVVECKWTVNHFGVGYSVFLMHAWPWHSKPQSAIDAVNSLMHLYSKYFFSVSRTICFWQQFSIWRSRMHFTKGVNAEKGGGRRMSGGIHTQDFQSKRFKVCIEHKLVSLQHWRFYFSIAKAILKTQIWVSLLCFTWQDTSQGTVGIRPISSLSQLFKPQKK